MIEIPTQCVKCNHPMRRAQVPIAKAPGTRQHRAHGLCKACYYVERKAGGVPEPAVRRKADPDTESSQYAYVFDERRAAAALEGWLRARRNRLARNGVAA
jgi:hypothetical protein